MRNTSRFLPVLLLGALSCAPTSTSPPGARSFEPAPGRRNVLTRTELAQAPNISVHDALRRLRPIWLTPRGRRGSSLPVVYVNKVFYGNLATLADFRAADVQSIRYLSAVDATIEFGTRAGGGVIEIRTFPE